jgi:malate dehydrogenase (quinone)
VVCAGGHRLKLAHDLGYGHHFSVLPVDGAYCFTPQMLNGKAYRVRNDRLPVLERYKRETVKDFMGEFRFDRQGWNLPPVCSRSVTSETIC